MPKGSISREELETIFLRNAERLWPETLAAAAAGDSERDGARLTRTG